MAGKKGDLDFKITADPMKAVNDLAKVAAKQEDIIQKLKKQNAEARRVDGGMRKVGDTANQTTGKILNWVGALLSIGGAAKGIKSVYDELKRVIDLQKQMRETTFTLEEIIQKTAHMRGSLSQQMRSTVSKEIEEIAMYGSVSADTAGKALYFAESTFPKDKARAQAVARAVVEFAGPAGLTPEDVIGIPRIMKAVGAESPEEIKRRMGQLYAAGTRSVAEFGPFLQAFTRPMVTGIERGFTLPEVLGLFSAAVETTGTVSEAGTLAASGLDVILGRSTTAFDYFEKYAKKKGVDYSTLSVQDRLKFTRTLYEEAKAGGIESEKEITKAFGGEAVRYLRQLFSEQGQAQFQLVKEAAKTTTGETVERLRREFKETPLGRKATAETGVTFAEADIAKERAGSIELFKKTEDVLRQAKAQVTGGGELFKLGMTPEGVEKRTVARMIVGENLAAAYDLTAQQSPERKKIVELYRQLQQTKSLTANPEFVQQVYDVTGGFELLRGGRLGNIEKLSTEALAGREKVMGLDVPLELYQREDPYLRGFQSYYGVGEESQKATRQLNETMKELTEVLKQTLNGVPAAAISDD